MALSFDEMIANDHEMMMNVNEFGISCTNTRTSRTFSVIKTDAFVSVNDDGIAITEDAPMFNTLFMNDVKQNDVLVIDGKEYRVRDIKRDGIGGKDIYLKG